MFFDHQASGTFAECERMAYYQLQLARRRKELALALDWGKTFHACVEIIKTYEDAGEAVAACETFINANLMEDPEDRYGRSKSRMFEFLNKWVQWRQLNPIKVLRHEQPTIIRCTDGSHCPYFEEGCGLEYGGIMDEIVEWQGYIGPLDYKTTVMTDSDPASKFRLSHQMMGYDWIASHLMGNHCWGAIVEQGICNKSKIEFNRYPIAFSRHLIEEWVYNERQIQADYQRKAAEFPNDELGWRQNRGRCWDPYPCQFRDVCLAPRYDGFRIRWLLDNTTEDRWDFMNRDKG